MRNRDQSSSALRPGGLPRSSPREAATATEEQMPEPGEYRYAATNRPLGYATAPRLAEMTVEPRPHDPVLREVARHGVAVYPTPLTAEECASYELIPIVSPAEVAAAVIADSNDGGYAAQYVEMLDGPEADAEAVRRDVGRRLQDTGMACAGGLAAVLPLVTAGLRERAARSEP